MIRPKRLRPGDTIGIAAPAGPIIDRARWRRGLARLRRLGYRPRYSSRILARNHYLAGTEARRTKELIALLEDTRSRAVILARGGYGSIHLLPALHKNRARLKPKIFMGYSDATVLLLYLTGALGWVTFHGPMLLKGIASRGDRSLENTLSLLQRKGSRQLWTRGLKVLKQGKARGPVLGGCLSLIVALCGTPFQPDFRGKILFLEDTGERFYEVDRMMTQLRLAGVMKGVRGIVLGPFRALGIRATGFFKNLLGGFKGPIVFGFPSGHCPSPTILPFGVPARLDTSRRKFELLKSCTL